VTKVNQMTYRTTVKKMAKIGLIGLAAVGVFALGLMGWVNRQLKINPRLISQLIEAQTGLKFEYENANTVWSMSPKIAFHRVKLLAHGTENSFAVETLKASIDFKAILWHHSPSLLEISLDGATIELPAEIFSRTRNSQGDTSVHFDPSALTPFERYMGTLHAENITLDFAKVDPRRMPIIIDRLSLSRDGRVLRLSAKLKSGEHERLNLDGSIKLNKDQLAISDLKIQGEQFDVPPFLRHSVHGVAPVATRVESVSGVVSLRLTSSSSLINVSDLKLRTNHGAISGDVHLSKSSPQAPITYSVVAAVAKMPSEEILSWLPTDLLGEGLSAWLGQNVQNGLLTNGHVLVKGTGDMLDKDGLQISFDADNANIEFSADWPAATNVSAHVIILKDSLGIDIKKARIGSALIERSRVGVESFAAVEPELTVEAHAASEPKDALNILSKSPLKSVTNLLKEHGITAGAGRVQVALNLGVSLGNKPFVHGLAGKIQLMDLSASINPNAVAVSELFGVIDFTDTVVKSENIRFLLGSEAQHLAFVRYASQSDILTAGELESRFSARNISRILNIPVPESIASGASNFITRFSVRSPSGAPSVFAVTAQSKLDGIQLDIPLVVIKPAATPTDFQLNYAGVIGGPVAVNANLGTDRFVAAATFKGESNPSVAVTSSKAAAPAHPGLFVVDLPLAKGTVTYSPGKLGGQVVANFERLFFTPSKNAGPMTAVIDPRKLPAFEAHCHDCRYGQRKFGDVAINSHRISDGLVFDAFNIEAGHFSHYNSEGFWRNSGSGEVFSLKGEIFVRDGGDSLRALNVANDLSGFQGRASYNAEWLTVPFLDGAGPGFIDAKFDLKDGNVAAGKSAFLVFSQLLTLKVLDVFNDGTDVCSLSGQLVARGPVVELQDIALELPTASLRLDGRANVAAQTMDTDVTMNLKFIGAANFKQLVANGNLPNVAKFLEQLTHFSYRLDGPWSDPKVKSVIYIPLKDVRPANIN
jgi:Protein of unknown function/AsmA-like C-terminal region